MALSLRRGRTFFVALFQTAMLPLQPAFPLNILGPLRSDVVTAKTEVTGQYHHWQSWSELIHLRSRHFAYCALPKSACTLWKQLLLRASGSKHWNTRNSTLIHHPALSGLDLVGVHRGMSPRNMSARNETDILELLNAASSLQTAVMVRDPVTRLLSAYLDRCVDNNEWKRCFSNTSISFEQTVTNVETKRKSGVEIKDIHLRNQTDMCGLRYMNYTLVGHMENFYNDSRTILQAVGLWEEFGENGWGANGSSTFGRHAPISSNHKRAHDTKSWVCHHYTPDLLQRIYLLYKPDFDAFGYNIQTWQKQCAHSWATKNQIDVNSTAQLRQRPDQGSDSTYVPRRLKIKPVVGHQIASAAAAEDATLD